MAARTGVLQRVGIGARFRELIAANRARVAAALVRERFLAGAEVAPRRTVPVSRLFGPPPATRADRVAAYERILASRRRLVSFTPDANGGRGAWVELVGRLGPATTHVGVLVPGGSAYLTDINFTRYHDRAAGFVEESGGRLAMLVWAADGWPGGWLQEARRSYDEPLARRLVTFCDRLRVELAAAGSPATVTAIGHSYGGAVVGTAERYGLDVDRVLHVASIGVGVWRPEQYGPARDRPRYSMTAPGDWIAYVQGVPGLGHGASPDAFPGVKRLSTGALPGQAWLRDEGGVALGRRAGAVIAGMHAHSLVFARYCDAWWNIYGVLTGGALVGEG